ncbi:MAG: O-antigen ligase family protein [Proteobacteria bacterium]|nr:O-antigen ligase family protein [Pseudomonadota bacterium]
MDQKMRLAGPIPLMWDHSAARRPAVAGAGTKAAGWAWRAFFMFGFSVLSAAIIPALRFARGEAATAPGEADPGSTISQAFILLVVTIYFVRNKHVLIDAMRPLLLYGAVIALCVASTAWSAYPFLTFKRCVTLTNCILFGIVCMEKLGLDGTIRIYGRTMVYLMIISIIVFIAIPSVGKEVAEHYEDGMRGIFSQKNQLGGSAALASASYCYALLAGTKRPFRTVLCILFMLLCIILSKSATAFIITSVTIGITAAMFAKRRGWTPLFVYAVMVVVVSILTLVIIDPELAVELTGRDASLTGRVPLWRLSMLYVYERPWTGYGYSGFWNEDSRAVQYIWQAIDWKAPSAHNGYIDVLLQIGIPGLALYLAMWIWITYYGALAARRSNEAEPLWILLFMTLVMLLNTDEGPLPYPDQYTAMMPAIMIYLSRWRRANLLAREPVRLTDPALGIRSPAIGRRPLPALDVPVRRTD